MSLIGRYLHGVLIGLDQLANTLTFGNPDETISSKLGRLKLRHGGRIPWHHPLARIIDDGLEVIDPGHSIDAIERRYPPRQRHNGPLMVLCLACRKARLPPARDHAQAGERYITYCEHCGHLYYHELFRM